MMKSVLVGVSLFRREGDSDEVWELLTFSAESVQKRGREHRCPSGARQDWEAGCVHWASKECAAAAFKGQFEY